MRFKKAIKFLLLRSFLKKYYFPGYLSLRKQLLINAIFQRVLGINGEVPWSVHYTSKVIFSKNINIGKDVWKSFALSNCCYIQGINGIKIGDYTIFAPGVKIISANHNFNFNKRSSHINEKPIEIGKYCWIGTNAIILPGVKLGDNTIVGAGSVVTKSFVSGNIVIAGNPAKIIHRIQCNNDKQDGEPVKTC